jgi:predicted membrane channel-forming protein YqfA (hemolysin III family)
VQDFLHEDTARLVHGIAATAFVVLLAALCFVFALRESRYGPARTHRVRLYVAMGVLILLAGLWAKFGVGLSLPFGDLRLGKTYVGEVVAFLAFGIAWLASGRDLKRGTLTERIGDFFKGRETMRSSVP